MISVEVQTQAVSEALLRYQAYTGKELGTVVKEQAKLLANRLIDLTPPKNKAQGTKRVDIDIGRVYLRNEWFENIFSFTNQRLGDRIKDEMRKGADDTLRQIFLHSQKLNRLHLEGFDPAKHKAARNTAGRVNYKYPYSYPVSQQEQIRAYIDRRKKNVGIAKSGWAACYRALGGSSPAWLSHDGGSVEDESQAAEHPYVVLTNRVAYFAGLDSKQNIVARALEGRARDMIKGAQKAVERAKRSAGL